MSVGSAAIVLFAPPSTRRAFCLQNGLSQHFGHLNQGSPEASCGHYATLTMRILNGVLGSITP
jgi:hypothetical protein